MIKSQLYSFFILSYFLSFNDCTPFHITYRNDMFSHHQEFGWDPPEPPPLPLPLPLPRAPLGAPTLRWLGLRVLWGQVTCCWNLLGSSGWGAGQWKSLLVDFFTCNKRKIDMCQINVDSLTVKLTIIKHELLGLWHNYIYFSKAEYCFCLCVCNVILPNYFLLILLTEWNYPYGKEIEKELVVNVEVLCVF